MPAVLQIVPALVSGGVERGTVDIAAALVRAGWRAVVASSGGPLVRELERAGAEHEVLPLASKNPLTIRRNARLLGELINRYPIDIVHARSRAPAWSALWATQQTGRHFVTTFHNAYGDATRAKRRYNAVMARGERVIAISEFVGQHAADRYEIPPDRLRVIHRGVDFGRFDPRSVTPARLVELWSKWRLEDGRPVIMLPGRMSRWKGHRELVDAVALLGRSDIQVVFVGEEEQRPAYREELVRHIAARGLNELFHFAGNCEDMPAAYMLADVVVSASIAPEGFGRVAVEAQAMGRPLIATDHGGSRETVIDGSTGWLVPPSDPAAMAEALSEALDLSTWQRLELADRARHWVSGRFSAGQMAAATLDVYSELLFPVQNTAYAHAEPA
jgi:glycosyltransferase involved in cell wall biosynthesis